MASVSSTHLVLFIAAILVAASLAGTVTEGATQLGSAISDQGQQRAEDIDAEIEVVSDAGSPESVYDHASGTLTLYVKNVGGSTIPADPDVISVLVNGEYQTDVETTVLDANSWGAGDLLRLRVDVSLQPRADTRVVVTPTGARDRFRFRTPTDDSRRDELVFATQGGGLRSIDASGDITQYDATAAAIGPKEVDLDDDGRTEIPYVNDSGALKLANVDETTTLVDNGVETDTTLLAVGAWNGSTSVFYVNTSDNSNIYRARPGVSPTQVTTEGGVQADAVAGVADVNGDGDDDLVYAGSSQGIHYIDGNQTHDTGSGVGQNNGIGIGAPREFDGTSPARVPGVDGSGNLALWDDTGTKSQWTSDDGHPASPVAGFDWRDNDELQMSFVEDGDIKYATSDGTIETVAANVSASDATGVA